MLNKIVFDKGSELKWEIKVKNDTTHETIVHKCSLNDSTSFFWLKIQKYSNVTLEPNPWMICERFWRIIIGNELYFKYNTGQRKTNMGHTWHQDHRFLLDFHFYKKLFKSPKTL